MEYTIRPFYKNDLLYWGTLSDDDEYKNLHVPILKSLLNADEQFEKCFVAIVDDEIVGYIYGFVIPQKITLPQFLYVKHENRRNGIGAALLRRFEKESNAPSCQLFYRKELHEYYKNLGYTPGILEVALKELTIGEKEQ